MALEGRVRTWGRFRRVPAVEVRTAIPAQRQPITRGAPFERKPCRNQVPVDRSQGYDRRARVVYGDIGTSPLLRTQAGCRSCGDDPCAVAGVVSLILWSLILIVSYSGKAKTHLWLGCLRILLARAGHGRHLHGLQHRHPAQRDTSFEAKSGFARACAADVDAGS